MADKFLKTMVMAGICFLATTGLGQAFSFEYGRLADQLKEDSPMVKAAAGEIDKAAVAIIQLWDSQFWGKLISDDGRGEFDRHNRPMGVGHDDGMLDLFDRDMLRRHGNRHAWFGHHLFDTDGENHGCDSDASAGHSGSFSSQDALNSDVNAVAPVPEPATMLLFGTGLMGLAGLGRRKIFKKSC